MSILKKSKKLQVTELDKNLMLHTSTTITYSLNRSIETIIHLQRDSWSNSSSRGSFCFVDK